MPSLADTARIATPNTVEGRAKQLWMELVKEAAAHKIPSRKTKEGEGYLINVSLAVVGNNLWGNKAADYLRTAKNHLKKTKNVIYTTETQQLFVSATYNERTPKKKTQRLAQNTMEQTILDRARSVWANARAHVERNGYPSEVYEGVLFYRVDKPLAFFISAVFPDLLAYEGGRRPIYEFLRATCNAVNLHSRLQEDESITGQHAWLIRDTWNEKGTVILFRTLTPDAIDKRAQKLTPREAGEDRPPSPVEVRQVQPTKEGTVVTAPKPAPPQFSASTQPAPVKQDNPEKNEYPCPTCDRVFDTPNGRNAHTQVHTGRPRQRATTVKKQAKAEQLPNGRWQCPNCDSTFETIGQYSGHAKVHYNENRDKELERLRRDNRHLRTARRTQANQLELEPEAALRIVTELVEGRAGEIEALRTEIIDLRENNAAQADRISQLNAELNDERRSGDVSTMLELLQAIVDQVNSGKIAPIRGMADVDDLIRGMKIK